jgi:tubulin polyglutamylase TTLL6/13
VKPCGDSQGRGIYLTRDPDTGSREEVVVQEYIENPLLLDQAKFDLRLYVLLRSLSPLRIYLYEEGLSRLATCDYERPSSANHKNMRLHLTNYAINKASPNFLFNRSQLEDHLGHKRSYSATLKVPSWLGRS